MIELIYGYFVEVDELNCTALFDTGKTSIDKKTGEERKVFKTIGYYGNIPDAIKACADNLVRKDISDRDVTLSWAVDRINTIYDDFSELVKKMCKGVLRC